MNATQFTENVKALALTIQKYKSGASGQNGECDCIGLVIGALRMGGVAWNGTHGTNYAARNEMRWMSPLDASSQLRTGMVVYKSREPGESGYSLPEKYKESGDLLDYYHVGMVTGVSPLRITHCTSPGPIVTDSKIGKWKWFGELNKVEAESESDGENQMETMYVIGGKLNLRSAPSTQADRLIQIASGEKVLADTYNNTWSRVIYTDAEGKTYEGYAVSQYLTKTPPGGTAPFPDMVSITLERSAAVLLKKALDAVLT